METSLEEIYPELPGSSEVPPPPRELFDKLRQRRGNSYRPRTRHLRPDGFAKYTNRLFLETSPYLQQHAHNPVNWFPWGDEAFDLARQLDRPLLVSIGYATCHWCHVMEEQSFEDEDIARYLNENYIAIKVDREERPDVDAVYMTALHAMGSQGGWPLNVFVTPEREPFYGGTYFPPFDHPQGIGFLSLLKRLHEAYRKEPERVRRAGVQLTEAVRGMLQPAQKQERAANAGVGDAIEAYRDRFDNINGGVRGAPKFPSSLPVRLLLRGYRRSGDSDLLAMAELTLRRMAEGGVYDQIGGGFHRYATDNRWMIPHFEKMLYDNALLTEDYLEGYQATGDPELARVAQEIVRYLQRDMVAEGSAFYAATDADSLTPSGNGEEGYFFTWTPEDLAEHLDEEQRGVVAALLGITRSGNFEGRSIPHRAKRIAEVARELKLTQERVAAILEESREILYRARCMRPLPLRDEKILCSWNGLAISALARAGLVLDDAAAVEQAKRCAGFVLSEMSNSGRLAHSYQDGGSKGEAFLDDYAFVIAGLIDLFEATGEVRWLESSVKLAAVVQDEFLDEELGGYFMTGVRHERLIAREKPSYDGVVPSGNSAMAMNLLRLHALTEQPSYLEQAKRTIDAFAAQLSASPTAFSDMLLAVDFLNDIPREVVIVTRQGNREAGKPFLDQMRTVFLPNRILACVSEGDELERASELVPLLRGKDAGGAAATAYFCENRSCRLPTSDPEEFGRQLREIGGRADVATS